MADQSEAVRAWSARPLLDYFSHCSDGYPAVTGPPVATLEAIGLSETDFASMLSRTTRREALGVDANIKWRTALGLASSTELPIDPWDWDPTFEAVIANDEATWIPAQHKTGVDKAEISRWLGMTFPDLVDECLTNDSDLVWQIAFPFRVRAEVGLRRSRLGDMLTIWPSIDSLRQFLLLLEGCRNYIFALNCCYYEWLTRSSLRGGIISWYHKRGALFNTATYLAASKKVTTLLKACVYPDAYSPFVEAGGMGGYRLLPDPNFDIIEATANAAVGFGDKHSTTDGLAASYGWMDCLPMLRVSLPQMREWISFKEFVATPTLWVTAGSSSYGYVQYTPPGSDRLKRVKARKLNLPFISSASELEYRARSTWTPRAVSLVKSELAKIRIAVSSELEFYLIWAYFQHLHGPDIYRQWSGVTLGENARTERIRLDEMVQATNRAVGFPADFETFDRQPLTDEITAIGASLVSAASTVGPLEPRLVDAALHGLRYSTLEAPPVKGVTSPKLWVKDQLPSGIAITSAVGNGFNAVASESQIRLVEAWTRQYRSLWLLRVDLRGDDSSFILLELGYGYLLALAAKCLNFRYAHNKVSLLSQGTEILRVSISAAYGCRGYGARLVPTLTQRKPWSNEPWDAEGSIRAQWDTCTALERRGLPGLSLWGKLTAVWSKKRGLPAVVLSVPTSLGGLGLGPVSEWAMVDPPLKTSSSVSVPCLTSSWGVELQKQRFAKVGVSLPEHIAHQLSVEALSTSLSTVDLPEMASYAQRAYADLLPTIRVLPRAMTAGLRPRAVDLVNHACTDFSNCDSLHDYDVLTSVYRPVWYGSERLSVQRILLRRECARLKLPTLALADDVTSRIATVRRHFRCSRLLAEDWVIGSGPTMVAGLSHPSCSQLVHASTAHIVERLSLSGCLEAGGFIDHCRLVAWQIGSALYSSKLHQRLYRW